MAIATASDIPKTSVGEKIQIFIQAQPLTSPTKKEANEAINVMDTFEFTNVGVGRRYDEPEPSDTSVNTQFETMELEEDQSLVGLVNGCAWMKIWIFFPALVFGMSEAVTIATFDF